MLKEKIYLHTYAFFVLRLYPSWKTQYPYVFKGERCTDKQYKFVNLWFDVSYVVFFLG